MTRQKTAPEIHRSGSEPPPGSESLVRFDPRAEAGKLIDSEHRGRYWWAAQAVAGRTVLDAGCGVGYGTEILGAAGAASVTGVDIDEETVTEARGGYAQLAESFLCADLRHLPMADESFDVVVCFETIQQINDGERALGELHRVLRPGGLLLISSPSPDVYAGNERHVHEYRPTELSAVIEERFGNVAAYRQHPWLASAIEAADAGETAPRRRHTRTTTELEPGAETYSILAASDAELPALESLVTLGHDFEVKWWAEQVAAAEGRIDEELAKAQSRAAEEIAEMQSRAREEVGASERQAAERIAAVEEEHRRVQERIETVERKASEQLAVAEAHAQGEVEAVERLARERVDEAAEEAERRLAAQEAEYRRDLAAAAARAKATEARLRKAGTALLEANQSLAKLPALQHRYDELEALRAHVKLLEGSKSWRYMAPLRWLWRVLGIRRRPSSQ